VGAKVAEGELKRSNGYAGAEVRQHGQQRAEAILAAGLRALGVEEEALRRAACNDWRKGLLAEAIQAETTVRLDWIRERLHMGDRSYCCRLVRRTRDQLPENAEWQKLRVQIVEMPRNHA
jgi:hypothetical protein